MADLKSFINTSSDRIKSAMGVPVDRVKAIQGSLLNLQDNDADAYILAEGITDVTLKRAITQLVIDLKAINTVQADFVNFTTLADSNRKAIYPFPGTGAANTRNLMNPTDADAANRLAFSAAPTISSKGVNFGGTKYADTFFAPNSLDVNDAEFDIALTDSGTELAASTDFGTYNAAGSFMSSVNLGGTFAGYIGSIVQGSPSITGFITQLQRKGVDPGKLTVDKDGYVKSNAANATGTLPSANVYIGRLNGISRYSNRTFGFVGIGQSISDAANILYKEAISRYNHALGRMPLKNVFFEGHSFLASNVVPNQISVNLNADNYTVCGYGNISSGGAKISDLTARIPTFDNYKKSISGIPIKNICVLWIGTNDTDGDGTVIYNHLVTYLQTQLAKGWHFILQTCTPKTASSPAWIQVFNDHLRNNTAGLSNCHVFDTWLYPELCDQTNTTYFKADLLHLTTAGYQIASDGIAAILKTL